ncbi:MAG TPA: PIG-L family deacetylase [Pyrinomonadaceae bacterium]|nr:PIG-L family deacetylase [Pyrinomonadaceae bacterium]
MATFRFNSLNRNAIRNLSMLLALLCATASLSPLGSTGRAQESSPSPSPIPTPESTVSNKAELHQALLDLSNSFTVMCVAAHPDDEDGTTLTVLRRKHGVHTVSLFTTYGEGGQNAVGPELYEELGVIRAQETLNASRIQGSEPHFIGVKDFGFSKSAEEAFKFWGHDETLRRMVVKIRELRPDVIITHHDTSRGHGHHQATGQLIIEAFDAAADPGRFPEQLSRLNPWQAQRLFVRAFGAAPPDDKTQPQKIITIDPNEVDPVRGRSFAEQALLGLQQHATQGPWPRTLQELLVARRVQGGKLPLIRYRLAREAPNAPALPAAATTFLDGLAVSPSLSAKLSPPKAVEKPLTELLNQPELVFENLVRWRLKNAAAPAAAEENHRAVLFEARLNKALAIASGVSLTISPGYPVLIPGRKTTASVNLSNAGSKSVQVNTLALTAWGKQSKVESPEHLLADTDTTGVVEITAPPASRVTVPKADHLYDDFLFGIPVTADAEVEIDGAKFTLNTQAHLDVVPAVEIKSVAPSPCVSTEESLGHCKVFNLNLANHLDSLFSGEIIITGASGNLRTRRRLVLGPNESRVERVIDFDSVSTRGALPELRKSASLKIAINSPGSAAPITERSVAVVHSNARVLPDLRVGYLPSFDQTLERSLASLSVEATALTVENIENNDLSGYDSIIIDNRGYEAHPRLVNANTPLLDYVQKGGTLIVFYHKDNEWNPDPNKNRPQLAPYPIVLGGDRVTDETAQIRIVQPRHLLLNHPNRINADDFKNWIQERGLYYPTKWDDHYTPLFSTNDPKEPPLLGGFLVARYGEGNYIYTSMVWYRQLRAGVPGAYRMLANMISYRKAQQRSFQRRRRGVRN